MYVLLILLGIVLWIVAGIMAVYWVLMYGSTQSVMHQIYTSGIFTSAMLAFGFGALLFASAAILVQLNPYSREPSRRCPVCFERIHRSAKRCPHCTSEVESKTKES